MYTDFCFKAKLKDLNATDLRMLFALYEGNYFSEVSELQQALSPECLKMASDDRAAFLFRSSDIGSLGATYNIARKIVCGKKYVTIETYGNVKNHEQVIEKLVAFLAKYAVTGFGYSKYEECYSATKYKFHGGTVDVTIPKDNYYY